MLVLGHQIKLLLPMVSFTLLPVSGIETSMSSSPADLRLGTEEKVWGAPGTWIASGCYFI